MRIRSHSALSIALCLGMLPVFWNKAETPKHDRRHYESTGEVVWEVPTKEKVVALTFDDGPDPDNTARILDLLKEHNAKATFFVIGEKVKRNPELVKREAEEGHELANHTYHHLFLSNRSFGKLEGKFWIRRRPSRRLPGAAPLFSGRRGASITTSLSRWPDGTVMWW